MAEVTYQLNTGGAPPDTAINLTDAATINVAVSAAKEYRVTLGGNRTMGNPTGAIDGQTIRFKFTQDATGNRLISWGSKYVFSTDAPAPVLSTGAGAFDFVAFAYDAINDVWACLGTNNGFSPLIAP